MDQLSIFEQCLQALASTDQSVASIKPATNVLAQEIIQLIEAEPAKTAMTLMLSSENVKLLGDELQRYLSFTKTDTGIADADVRCQLCMLRVIGWFVTAIENGCKLKNLPTIPKIDLGACPRISLSNEQPLFDSEKF